MTADAVGGVWTYALELARALEPFGVETTIATMGPPPSVDQIAEAADVPGLDLVTGPFKLEWMDDAWGDVAAAGAWLLDLESSINPFLIHLNGYAHAALSWRSPVVVVGHSCVASWADAVGGSIDAGWLARYRLVVTAGLRAADWVIAPTAAMLAALRRQYGPLDGVSVVPNGRDARRFVAQKKEPFVFGAGRLWDRAKNLEALMAITPRVSWPVVVAGHARVEGDLGPSCADRAERTGPLHVGQLSQTEIAVWLARASIFALPARYEPFGLLPLEAALSRCALVLGDIDSLREVWGDAAVYVEPEDRDSLRAAIERLVTDPVALADYAARAYARARTYTPARMAKAYADIYSAEILRCAS
jgi:glycosyltransferase involved in cell wall biosynthesis